LIQTFNNELINLPLLHQSNLLFFQRMIRGVIACPPRPVTHGIPNRRAGSRQPAARPPSTPGIRSAACVDFELRETYESALVFGRHALEAIGLDPERAREVEEEVRRRDLDRLALQQAGDIYAGADLMPYGTLPHEPLSAPKRKAVPLNPEAADVIKEETEVSG
jgi:hypothetical protein